VPDDGPDAPVGGPVAVAAVPAVVAVVPELAGLPELSQVRAAARHEVVAAA
jgi:hypothetical protein